MIEFYKSTTGRPHLISTGSKVIEIDIDPTPLDTRACHQYLFSPLNHGLIVKVDMPTSMLPKTKITVPAQLATPTSPNTETPPANLETSNESEPPADTTSPGWDSMKVKELKAELTTLGIKFPDNANRSTLLTLLYQHLESATAQEPTSE